jgi:hypothetical protein
MTRWIPSYVPHIIGRIKEGPLRFALLTILTLTLLGCSRETATQSPNPPIPSAPSAPAPVASSLWGMVLDESGGCIEGASVEVVRGQGVGQRITQETPCGYWDYGGGFILRNLAPDVELTIRASAFGYGAQDKTFFPSSRIVFISLSKIQ